MDATEQYERRLTEELDKIYQDARRRAEPIISKLTELAAMRPPAPAVLQTRYVDGKLLYDIIPPEDFYGDLPR